jgi:DNA-binding NarL/FixJ family response regulator
MDGIEATQRIKAELPDVRVIGLSMYEDKHSAQNITTRAQTALSPKQLHLLNY